MTTKNVLISILFFSLQTSCMEIEPYSGDFENIPTDIITAISYRIDNLSTLGAFNSTCKKCHQNYVVDNLVLGNLKITANLTDMQHATVGHHSVTTHNFPLLKQLALTDTKRFTNIMDFFNFPRRLIYKKKNIIKAYQGKCPIEDYYIDKAITMNNPTALKIMLLSNPNMQLNENFPQDGTALTWASFLSLSTITKILLQHACCNINKQITRGHTALHFACINANKDLVDLLLQHKCNQNIKNGSGDTPLHIAARNRFIPIAKLLLLNGANTTIENAAGKKALEYLSKKQREQLLHECGLLEIKDNQETRTLLKKRKCDNSNTTKKPHRKKRKK